MRILILFLAVFFTLYASSAEEKGEKITERITKKQLLSKDKLFHYTATKPCWMDKHKYFCCPVRKIVRRSTGKNSWIDYCYNSRDELIGSRSFGSSEGSKRSSYSAIGGCTLCGSRKMTNKRWTHSYNPKLAPPKKRRK